MGKRGRNKTGYYRVLLHLLELQYALEHRARGDSPARWRPSPRNRPDQFLRWALSSTSARGDSPVTLNDVFARLEREKLPHVAALLAHIAGECASAGKATEDALNILSVQHTPETEAHPQARKFSSTLSRSLDAAWLGALIKTEAHAASQGWPACATLLGGLPPGFGTLYTLLHAGFSAADPIDTPAELSVFQFYGLATGTLPPPPAPYACALGALGSLTSEDVTLLGSLSAAQALQLRRLEPRLLSTRSSALCTKDALTYTSKGCESSPSSATCERHVASTSDEFLETPPDAPLDAPLDEELRRMIARKEVTGTLVKALRGGDEALWGAARALLNEASWATLYLEDSRSLQELFNGRTAAKLNLRDVFPRTVAWLDEKLKAHIDGALYQETGGIAPAAHAYSCHVRKLLLGARHPQSVQFESLELKA